jgi:hypothetical protein
MFSANTIQKLDGFTQGPNSDENSPERCPGLIQPPVLKAIYFMSFTYAVVGKSDVIPALDPRS